jgi:hypothetical protein
MNNRKKKNPQASSQPGRRRRLSAVPGGRCSYST